MSEKTIRARIHGTVQGVCFRDYTRRKAEALQVRGWVRNCPDGTVEALVSGPPDAVEEMVEWLHTGSPYGEVTRVDVTDEEPDEPPQSFTIAY